MPIAGGLPHDVCAAETPRGGSWGEDDFIIFANGLTAGLFRVPASGGTAQSFTTLADDEANYRHPHVLPGARGVLFTAVTKAQTFRIAVQASHASTHRMLVPEGQNAKFGADRLVYGSARGEIFSVPFDSVSLTITGPPVAQRERPRSSVVGHQALSLSRNGTMVYVPRQSFLRRLAIVDRHGSVQPVLEAPVREYDTPVLSPDGSPARLSPGSGSAAAQTETLPIVFQRTPYGVGQNTAAGIATALADLPADGYIIVLQDLGPLSNANRRYFRESIPTWNDFVQHPDYDAFWKRQAFAPWLNRVTVPTLNVAGWWDQEDFFGPIKIYELLEKHDTKNENFLVVGPWNHGGWSRGTGRTLGRIDFGSDTATHYRRNIMATFLAHYLKDQGAAPASEALTFRTGANEWTQHDAWPPLENVTERRLYFQEGGKLAFTAPPPAKEGGYDTYVSDPHSPVPYRPRPITLGRGWSTWLVEDQRFVHGRPDVRTYLTDPLSAPVVVSGKVSAKLFAATSGTDSDWVVKLIDVYPEKYQDETMRGFQLMVAADVIRGRYHKSIDHPTALAPNVPVEYVIPFPANDHAFQPGHRIMVQVQSSWFPVTDRNPQKFVPNIFLAQPADFIQTTQRIYRSGAHASHISLPVVSTARP